MWSARLCCGLLRREIVQCNLGCAPWRMLTAYGNVSSGGNRGGGGDVAAACAAQSALWEQPAPRGTETELLHPNKRQTWPNGAMKCDFCEGFFNGWRGF